MYMKTSPYMILAPGTSYDESCDHAGAKVIRANIASVHSKILANISSQI